MLIRVVTAAVLSALLMFGWGFVFWGPVFNATSRLVAALPPEAERDVLPPLRSAQTPDGMYAYPGPLQPGADQAAADEWTKRIEAGPVFHMAYHREGVSPLDPAMFAKGLAHNFVVALLAGSLLAMVAHALPIYASRVGVLTLVTLIATLWTNVANVIWWMHTPRYAGGQILYGIVAGMLMALVTAAIVRPREEAASTIAP